MMYGLLGYCKIYVEARFVPEFLQLCHENSYPYVNMQVDEYGNATFVMRYRVFKKAEKQCQLYGIEISLSDKVGLPFFLYGHRSRLGLAIGALVAVFIVLSFQNTIWDIRISGNDILTDSEIIGALDASGLSVGASKVGFKADVLENRVMILDKRIAWISVNIKGTVAYVQVRESKKAVANKENLPANLVAARSGVIQRIELLNGNVIVAAGDRVNEGELLVSGIYDSTVSGFRITRAEAKVYARCVREINIFVPRTEDVKVYADDDSGERELSLNFFGKEIKFSKKGRKERLSCDIIQCNKSLTLIKGISLPVSIESRWYIPYTVQAVTRTDAELEALAYYQLSQRLLEIPGGAEIIKKTVVTSSDDSGYYVECTLVCIEDIARVVEFEVTQ